MSMFPSERPELQRFRYWQGQTLRSRDFRDQESLDATRRQLHKLALHGGPGVSIGLEVHDKAGAPGMVVVSCGLAYDCSGREVVLQRPREIAIPEEASWLVIRIGGRVRGAGLSSACCPPPSEDECAPIGAQDLDRETELFWQPDGSLDRVNGAVLAKATDSKLDAEFQPRLVRPLSRPHLARGESIRGNTPWEPWEIDEPDGKGGLRKKVVGVQTRIDTSSAGFTETPCYFASLNAPAWDLGKTEFAPAFFPHVANATVDGFTFRLLMAETARRRYSASFGAARITKIDRGVGDRLLITVDGTAPFRKNDAVALLRPRGNAAFLIKEQTGLSLTLDGPLTEVEAGKTVLAVGNAPRAAKVTAIAPEDPAVLVSFTVAAGPNPKKNDVLVRFADGASTLVSGMVSGKLRVGQPFPTWTPADAAGFAPVSGAVAVKSAAMAADGTNTSIVLKVSAHNLIATESVVLLNSQKAPLAVCTVLTSVGDTIEVQPPLAASMLPELKHAALVRKDITISLIQPQSPGAVATVDKPGVFREGEFVAAAADVSKITVIDKITGAKLSLRDAIPLVEDVSVLVAANWLGAATVDHLGTTAEPEKITVARTGAIPPSSFVARREGDLFSAPRFVEAATGTSVTLDAGIPGLARLDTLAIGAFPRIVTVVLQEQPDRVLIAEAGTLLAGDILMPLDDSGAPAPLARVRSAAGGVVSFTTALPGLQPGDRLGVVNFRDTALLTNITPSNPAKIKVDRDIESRDNDFVAVFTHYQDNSNPGFIESISAQTLTLAPGIASGDGVAPDGWIDGGILGPAAVSFPAPFQPLIRLKESEGLQELRPATAYGFDLLSGEFRSNAIYPYLVDPAANLIYMWPLAGGAAYRYRPETLSVVTTFNTDFPRMFSTFAQKQNLAVSWIGCQEELPRPSVCPGTVPYDEPCAKTEPTKE